MSVAGAYHQEDTGLTADDCPIHNPRQGRVALGADYHKWSATWEADNNVTVGSTFTNTISNSKGQL